MGNRWAQTPRLYPITRSPDYQITQVLDRVRRRSGARSGAAGYPRRRRLVRRLRFGRARLSAARARAARRTAGRRPRALQSSVACRRGRRRAFLRRLAARLAGRCSRDRADVAARARTGAPFGRRRGARGALRVSSSARVFTSRPTSSRSGTRATIRPKPFCSASCAAPGSRGWPACTLAAATSSGRCSTAGAPTCGHFLEERGACRSSTTSRTTMSASRAIGCARSCCRCCERRFNPSIVDVLADEATLAREEWRWIEQAARRLADCGQRDRLCLAHRRDGAERAAARRSRAWRSAGR